MTEKKNLQEKLEEELFGCPYFFDNDCDIKITETIFNKYCLEDYKKCYTYQFIQKDEGRFIGSRK